MPSIFGNTGGIGGGTLNLLAVGKRLGAPGIGLSRESRALADKFIKNTASTGNALFSAGLGASQSIEALQTQIKAIRASKSESQLAPSLRAPAEDSGNAAADENRGTNVDTEI